MSAETSTANLYNGLEIPSTLGQMKCIALRTLLLEIGAKDLRNLTPALQAELKATGLAHVMPESEWIADRDSQLLQLSDANQKVQGSIAAEKEAKRVFQELVNARDGFWNTLLRRPWGKVAKENQSREIISASMTASIAEQSVHTDEAAAKLLQTRSEYLNTFAKSGEWMIALSEHGKQVVADLRNESDAPFLAFAAARVNTAPDTDPVDASIPRRSHQFRFSARESNGRRWGLSSTETLK